MRESIQRKINLAKDSLELCSLDITDIDISSILEMLRKNKYHLSSIFLQNNKITDKGALILSQGLKRFPKLKFIDLQFNQIGEKGAAAIMELKRNHTDLKIALHGNKITNVTTMQNIEDTGNDTN